jgi:hypothetical protein
MSSTTGRAGSACLHVQLQPGAKEWHYRRALEDNRRQIAEAGQRQREFEKQKAAEIEAAKEPTGLSRARVASVMEEWFPRVAHSARRTGNRSPVRRISPLQKFAFVNKKGNCDR